MTDSLPWTDRLRQRGFVDQWGFMAFAIIGFVGILSAKAMRVETVWVAIGAVALMLLYAMLIAKAGTGRLKADQAGDNCYYLGLIYTLTSLSYAIFTFDPDDTATTIVQGFGVALATTIVGLILRVFFNQGRPDLEDTEIEVRTELADAVGRLKAEINAAVRDLHDFNVVTQQRLEEMHQSAAKNIEAVTKVSVTGMQDVAAAAAAVIQEEADEFKTRSKRYTTTFDSLLTKVERHGGLLDGVANAQEQLTRSTESIGASVDDSRNAVEAILATSSSARTSVDAAQESVASARQIADQLLTSAAALQKGVASMNEAIERRLDELAAAPALASAAAVESLERASKALESHLGALKELHTSTLTAFELKTRNSTELAADQNRKLADELDRSRELVGKVHSSLADMTDRLATSLERSV